MVCVVLTGIPKLLAVNNVIAPAASAENPPNGWSLVILLPIVWTIRQPPDSVPSAIAKCAAMMTQKGISNALK